MRSSLSPDPSSTRREPEEGSIKPARIPSKVDLPDPDGPVTAVKHGAVIAVEMS